MTGALASLIFSGLLIIVAVDRPFSGTVKVGPEALVEVLEDFGGAQGGVRPRGCARGASRRKRKRGREAPRSGIRAVDG